MFGRYKACLLKFTGRAHAESLCHPVKVCGFELSVKYVTGAFVYICIHMICVTLVIADATRH